MDYTSGYGPADDKSFISEQDRRSHAEFMRQVDEAHGWNRTPVATRATRSDIYDDLGDMELVRHAEFLAEIDRLHGWTDERFGRANPAVAMAQIRAVTRRRLETELAYGRGELETNLSTETRSTTKEPARVVVDEIANPDGSVTRSFSDGSVLTRRGNELVGTRADGSEWRETLSDSVVRDGPAPRLK